MPAAMSTIPSSAPPAAEPLRRAREVAEEVLLPAAADVDAAGRFPAESIAALREAGLLALLVPAQLGGLGGSFSTFAEVAGVLGAGCPSTGLIFAMHCQQVAVLARHGGAAMHAVLAEVAARGLLVASVTSESGKGGELTTALAPLEPAPGGVRVRRRAPIVSYGGEADLFLVSMRAAADRAPTDVRLVLLDRRDGGTEVTGGWDAMGMRGTRSVPMRFDVAVPLHRVLAVPMAEMAARSMIPAGHTGWAAVWLGAARGAFRRFVPLARRQAAAGERRASSDVLACRLAELRLRLDLVGALLATVCERLDALDRRGAAVAAYAEAGHTIELNALKVAAARDAFAAVDGLMGLAGLEQGYLRHRAAGLERVFRDLRSASLMFHDDRLLLINGRLLLVEESPLAAAWGAAVGGGGARTTETEA